MSDLIQFSVEDGVGILRLNRPDKYNSFVREMALEFQNRIRQCMESSDIRAIYVTGNGKAFCAGQDLAEAIDPNGPELSKIVSEHYNPIIELIRNCELPVVCGVNGVAAGAGANIALAADVVIASENAAFIQAFTRIGLIPDAGGTYWLPRQMGFARAMGAALFADRVSARQAADWGMIYEAVPDDGFDSHWRARAAHLSSGPTQAFAGVKRALRESLGNSLDEQLALEAKLQGRCGRSSDFREGVMAFLEKRPAQFTGT